MGKFLKVPSVVPLLISAIAPIEQKLPMAKHKCPVCFVVSTHTIIRLKKHIIRKHENMKAPDGRCKTCGRRLKGHIKPIHYGCKLLGIDENGLKLLQDYDQHFEIRMNLLDKELKFDKSQQPFKLPFVSLSCFVCEIECFSSSSGVFKHVDRIHGPQQQLFCKNGTCGDKVFISANRLQSHERKHHNDTIVTVCDECGKGFRSSSYCAKHKDKVHTLAQKIKPKYVTTGMRILKDFNEDCRCDIDFESQNYFYKVRHFKLIHLGYEQCSKCKKCTPNLEAHTCYKKKKKPFQNAPQIYNCDECVVVKFSKHGITTHIQKVHRPGTLLQCKLCPKLFMKDDLKKHMTRGACMVKPSCTICGKVVSKLTLHMETVHMVSSNIFFLLLMHFLFRMIARKGFAATNAVKRSLTDHHSPVTR